MKHRRTGAAVVAGPLLLAGCGVVAVATSAQGSRDASTPSPHDIVTTVQATSGSATGSVLGALAMRPRVHLPSRPNIVMITSDDAAVTDLRYMPRVRNLLVRQGTRLTDAIAPTPLCVPARASLVTGQYATNHGARTISGPHGGAKSLHERTALPVWLHRAGYRTWFTGKYLNGYGESGVGPRHVPPGWDQWRATVDPTTYNFMEPVVNINGHLKRFHAYSTDVIRKQSLAMLGSHPRSHRPFFLWVNYVAPHFGGPHYRGDPAQRFRGTRAALKTTVPAPRDRGRFAALHLPDLPNMFERDVSDKPKASPSHHDYGPHGRHAARLAFDRRIEALQDVDRSVGATIGQLRRMHQLQHTLVIFASDNGYVVGQNHYVGKLWAYNDILRIPMVIRGPGVPRGKVVHTAVTNPDIATTIARVARARPEVPQDGVNILPWLHAPTRERVVPIVAWPLHNGAVRPKYAGVRVGPWTYVRYRNGAEELYDRVRDPYELHNIAHRARFHPELEEMRALSTRYRHCAGSTCPKTFYRPSNLDR